MLGNTASRRQQGLCLNINTPARTLRAGQCRHLNINKDSKRQVLLSSKGLCDDVPAPGDHKLQKPVHYVASSFPRLDMDKSVDERISYHLIHFRREELES